MASLNRTEIIGNLGKDPETREVNGDTVCKFTVATSEKWKTKSGDEQEHTEWYNVVAWGKLGEICDKYLSKGRLVFVAGSLRTRKVEGEDGTVRYFTDLRAREMLMLDGKGDNKPAADDGGSDDF